MQASQEAAQEPIAFEWPAFSEADIAAFENATGSQYTEMAPPTLATIFRWGEFRWLERMKVNMRHLLHTEQTYEFLTPIRAGQKHQVQTKLGEIRERRGMRFVTLESTVSADGEIRLKSVTNFVVRSDEGGAK